MDDIWDRKTLDEYPDCVCGVCQLEESYCQCSKGDIFKAASLAWQRDYDETESLRTQIETLKSDAVVLAGAVEIDDTVACWNCRYCDDSAGEQPCGSCLHIERGTDDNFEPTQSVIIARKYREKTEANDGE